MLKVYLDPDNMSHLVELKEFFFYSGKSNRSIKHLCCFFVDNNQTKKKINECGQLNTIQATR